MIRTEEEHLAHYGILRRSGRYPWGSGKDENTRNRDFLDIISQHKKDGMSEAEIAKGYGITTTELRAAKSIASAQQKQEKRLTAQRLKDKGWSNVEIGKRMGINESSVRSLLSVGAKDKVDALHSTANMLREQVRKKAMIDVGKGVEYQLGVTKSRLDTAVALLKEEGYAVHNIKIMQLGTGKFTTMKVLAHPGTTLSEVQKNRHLIQQIQSRSEDHGRTFQSFQPPKSLSSKRVGIVYGPDGGSKSDGVIYVRPGVKDLSLGQNNYAQVRIMVDGTHYIKGMAVYKDDMPPGHDVIFHTSKSNTGNKKDVMKEISSDPENPFGAITSQVMDSKGRVTSVMNKVNDEGTWDTWSKNLPSQFLSKQSPSLATQQLKTTYERRVREYDEISSLTNPSVRKDLLMKFADETDSASVHLKAASLPRQATKVLLPVPSMKPDEIYAPSMRNGEQVALVRFPHGGTFEIPQLKVNNRNPQARKMLGTAAKDAVGIHHSVAQRLSGADFDGDTVLVIPNSRKQVKSSDPLDGLKDFDPQSYKIPKDSPIPRMTAFQRGQEMGKISNLITDMTIRGQGGGASSDEIARAIRHSMVVIDAEKHGLDYRQSEKDHGILQLKEKYQGSKKSGATTLISQAKAPKVIPERQPRSPRRGGPIDPVTGKKVYEPTGRMINERKLVRDPITGEKHYVDTGRKVPATIRVPRLGEAEDAFSLSSGTQMEAIYAVHSNKLKSLANEARKQALATKAHDRSPSAAKAYANEVASLNAKLNLAKKNAPYERHAQLLANAQVSARRQANPHMEKAEVKKLRNQELTKARARTGAGKDSIVITKPEWDAIQAGAISKSKLDEILRHSDTETVKKLALPKRKHLMTGTMKARAQSMLASGYTQQEVADALGIGLTTLKVGLNG